MSRTVRDSRLESRAARARLSVGTKLHWKVLEPARLHLGYRRKRKDEPGMWLARRYKGGERYQVVPLGLADDYQDAAPGILDFAAAQRAAHAVRWNGPRRRSPAGITVAEAIADYVAWLHDNRATGYDAELRAKALILPRLGSYRVAELTSEAINDWLHWVVDQPALWRGGHPRPRAVSKEQKRARRASANRVLTTLKAALNRAFRAGLTDDDTAWRRIKPFERVTTQRPGFLLLHECKRLINASEGDFRTLVHAALLTGARYGELRNLLVRDCALGKVHVRKSKSGRPRHIVLTEEGVRFFTQLSAGRAGDEWLLLRAGRQWNKSEQARPMRAACLRAAITPPIGFHQLRHSYASLSVMADMPLPVLARNLGHASTRMIEQHYGHMRADFVDEAIKAAAPRFGMVGKTNVRPL